MPGMTLETVPWGQNISLYGKILDKLDQWQETQQNKAKKTQPFWNVVTWLQLQAAATDNKLDEAHLNHTTSAN